MQGILLIYLYYSVQDQGLGIPQATAAGMVGAYGGAVYLSTILGAWLADRVLGSERVLFCSAVVIMVGHISLALLPGASGVIVGLLLVAFGSGGLKANATRVVGTLYTREDPRRDAGFSIFYLGINLGAFFGPLLTGLLQTTLGFHWGFGARRGRHGDRADPVRVRTQTPARLVARGHATRCPHRGVRWSSASPWPRS